MMDWVRKNVGLIAGFTVAVMVLWLVGTAVSVRATQADIAGVLFGKKIMLESYVQALDAVTRQALLTRGDKFREETKPEELEQLAWQRLTMLAEAKRRRFRVTDEEVITELQRWPIFQRDGQFDRGSYEAIVKYSLGTSPRHFEEEMRESLMIYKLTDEAIKTDVTDHEVSEAFQAKEEAIKVSYFTVPQETAAREIADSLRQNPALFKTASQQVGQQMVTTDLLKRSTSVANFGLAGKIFEPLFLLNDGEVSGPLETSQGWLIARLESKSPADLSKLEGGKEAIRRELLEQKKLSSYFTWYSELLKRANLKKTLPTDRTKKRIPAPIQQQSPAPSQQKQPVAR